MSAGMPSIITPPGMGMATVAGGANAITTLTITTLGSGYRIWVVALRIVRVATAALAGGAILTITSTNLNGAQWRVGNNMIAGGTQIDMDQVWDTFPLRGLATNTNVTITAPAAGAAVSWDMIAWFVHTAG